METEVLSAVVLIKPEYTHLTADQIRVIPLVSGSNQVYKVEFPCYAPLIYRKFGACPLVTRSQEHTTFMRVAAAGLGPTCIGVGAGYRLEEWLEGGIVQRTEVEGLVEPIASAIARFHRLDHGRGEGSMKTHVLEWRSLFEKQRLEYEHLLDTHTRQRISSLFNFISSEQTHVFDLIPSESELIFSHNDLSCSNILKRPNGSLLLLDYEYSGLDCAASDLAMLTNEVTYEYFPTAEICFRRRLDQSFSQASISTLIETYCEDSGLPEEQIRREFYRMKPAKHYYCLLWALCKYQPGTEAWFDLLSYAESRLSSYLAELDNLP